MQLILTVIGPNKKKYDIQVDNRQHIATTLRVIDENIAELAGQLQRVRVRVKKSGRILELQNTYEEEGIYTGDELIISPIR
ncbi:hypothetical protein D5278_19475 [bacterium 1XD21-13]|nr:hypothetical protein [bacterium 1XD21-13]